MSVHSSRQHWLVAEWLGRSVTVRFRVDDVLGKSQYNDLEVAIERLCKLSRLHNFVMCGVPDQAQAMPARRARQR